MTIQNNFVREFSAFIEGDGVGVGREADFESLLATGASLDAPGQQGGHHAAIGARTWAGRAGAIQSLDAVGEVGPGEHSRFLSRCRFKVGPKGGLFRHIRPLPLIWWG